VLAAACGGCAVVGAWELLRVADDAGAVPKLLGTLRPLRTAGETGRDPTTLERRRLAVLGTLVLLAAGWLAAGPVGALVAGAAGPAAIARAVAARRRRWRAELAGAAPAVSRALADALAGGHSIRGALAEVGSGGPGLSAAARHELHACAAALALGQRTEVALESLRARAAHPSYDTIVAAVLLQREAGGDLARLLRSISGALEQARRDEADARGATAQARFTAGIVCILPAGAALLAELSNPGVLGGLVTSPVSGPLLGAAAVLQVLALLAVGRIARVVA
jgi:tight adherence protein B